VGRQIKNIASVGITVAAMAAFGLVLRAQDPQPVGTWRAVGPMAHSYPGAAVAALADGRTVIAGGQDADGSLRDSVLLLDPVANQIVEAGRLLEPRAGHTATALADGRVLIAGGQTAAGISADVEVFDLATGTSLLTAMLWEPRTTHAAAALRDGRVLIVGGTSQTGVALATAEIFATNPASVVPVESVLGVPRRHASASTLPDGRVLVAGGNDGVQDLSSAELFVPAYNAFAPLDAANVMSAPRSGHTALVLPHNNGVLIAGGVSNGAAMASVEVFLPAEFPDPYSYGEGRFAPTASMAASRAPAISGPVGDNGYAFAAGGAADAEIYRFATIKTDKGDYAPGERAIITGSGWQPGEDVRLVFQEDPAVHDDYVLTVTADNQGNIYWDQWAPEQHDLNVRFYLSAVDSRSRAQITFTDGLPQLVTVNPSSVSVDPGATADYTTSVQMGGNATDCTITLQVIAGLPPGATATFDDNPVTGSVSFSRALRITTTSGVTPGAHVFAVRASKGSNCQGSSGNAPTGTGTLIVNGAPSILTLAAVTGTYGGSATLSATLTSGSSAVASRTIAFALNGVGVGSATTNATGVATLSNVSVAGLDAGSYPTAVSASFAGDDAYLASTAQNSLTIGKALATVHVSGYTGVYDGDAHGASGSATGVNGEDLTSRLSLGATFTDVPGGTANWSFAGDDNYEPANGSATITITRATALISVAGFSGPYDGYAHGASGSVAGVNGEDLSGLLNLGATYTNVPGGEATWTFAGNNNYDGDEGTVAIVITKVHAVVIVTGFSGVYDGTAHGASGSAVGVLGESLAGLLNLGATFTDVPGGTANWAFAGDGNYLPRNGSVEIAISQADAIVTVDGYNGVYDGDPHGATGNAVGVLGEDLSNLLSLGASYIDVPGGAANWTFAGNLNYKADEGSVEIVIGKAAADVVVNGYTGVYDGDAHGATGSALGVNEEDLSGLLSFGESFTNAPGGTATWSFAGDTNYNAQTGTVAIVISKADAIVTVSGYTGAYDGDPHTATGSALGVNDEDLSGLLSFGETFTNVPGGTANWSFAGGTNYNAQSGTAAIVISRADAIVTVLDYSGVYDGDPHNAAGSATGVKGENLAALLNLGASFTNVPGGTASWSFAGDTNYNAQNGTAQIVISKADATVNVSGYTGVYDGDPHGATGAAMGVKGENLTGLLSLGATYTNVPGGSADWSFAGDNNYKAAAGSVGIVISQANAIVQVYGYSGVYDGNPHGASGSAAGVKGEDLSSLLNLGASYTNVPGGPATWNFAGNLNYRSATGVVTIAIEKANQVITWAMPASIVFGTPLSGAQLNAVLVVGDGALTYNPGMGSVLAVGTQTLDVHASETNNYHPATKTVTLTVNPWHLTGFYNPVTMGGQAVMNTVKGGSTVPLKFNIYTSNGGTELTGVSDITGFYVWSIGCSAASLDDPIEMTTTGGTTLRYDATGRQFIQNWQTPKGAGVCYQVTMKARDGSTVSAFFKTK
jgi:hypothetical protein